MYLIIPIAFFALSLVVVLILIARKFVYLKKLTPEAISDPAPTMSAFWAGLFPEVVSFFGAINWREYRVRITSEIEKAVRRLRLLFLKTESVTHKLSIKLRKSKEHHEGILVQEEEAKLEEEKIEEKIDPKEEEQRLIMEIGKSPKDPLLYMRLGDIYLETGEIENARTSFETVLQLDPENWYAKKKVGELPKKPE